MFGSILIKTFKIWLRSHSLKEIGFRGFLADAIASRVIDIDYFESMLVTIAEPISSNSLIISNNGTLFSLYAVERGSSSLELAGHTELTLHVVDDPPDRPDTKKLLPIPFIIQDMNWQPGRFAEYVYRQIQCMLHNRGHDYCVYGHCTSEQAAVDMSRKGHITGYGTNRATHYLKETATREAALAVWISI